MLLVLCASRAAGAGAPAVHSVQDSECRISRGARTVSTSIHGSAPLCSAPSFNRSMRVPAVANGSAWADANANLVSANPCKALKVCHVQQPHTVHALSTCNHKV